MRLRRALIKLAPHRVMWACEKWQKCYHGPVSLPKNRKEGRLGVPLCQWVPILR